MAKFLMILIDNILAEYLTLIDVYSDTGLTDVRTQIDSRLSLEIFKSIKHFFNTGSKLVSQTVNVLLQIMSLMPESEQNLGKEDPPDIF